MLLGDVEGLLEVVGCVGPRQLVKLYEVRSAAGTTSVSGLRSRFHLFVIHLLYLCLCMRALKARPSLQQVVKFWMLTSGYL